MIYDIFVLYVAATLAFFCSPNEFLLPLIACFTLMI